MSEQTPEKRIREVVDACADCDSCRYFMLSSCLFFEDLFFLVDRERSHHGSITDEELRRLADRCNLCALCPCPNIRAGIIEAKTLYAERDGLPFSVRLMQDVPRACKVCGTFPNLANRLTRHQPSAKLLKKALGIHPERKLPALPDENFPDWWARRAPRKNMTLMPANKVILFVGCTGNYLFPEVPRAAASFLEANGIEVVVPDLQCCGMPPHLEGDRRKTHRFVTRNIEMLNEGIENGYDIVCSCPTCGFMLKKLIPERAVYARQYQESIGADPEYIKIPKTNLSAGEPANSFQLLRNNIYGKVLKDDGYFSTIDPIKRIRVAANTYDLGEYLIGRIAADHFPVSKAVPAPRVLYYPPCHLREQKIGLPYVDILKRASGIDLQVIDGNFYCCGISGIMGFKRTAHPSSVRLAQPLIEKIESIGPDLLLTDCLSCRLQFQQLTSRKILHPIEFLTAPTPENNPRQHPHQN